MAEFSKKLSLTVARGVLRLPPKLARRVAGKPIRADQQVLDPHLQILFALGQKAPDGGFERAGSVEAARRFYEDLSEGFELPVRAVPGTEDRTLELDGVRIPVRLYGTKSGNTNAPAVVYFHGGGFVLGGLATHDRTCRRIAHGTGAIVIAVDYRLGPEHPFPAAPDDCEAVTRWVIENADSLGIDPARVAVAGDSAGGNLSAVVSQRVPGLCFALLIYPSTDSVERRPSWRSFERGFALDTSSADWCFDLYASGAALDDPQLSPLRGSFEHAPPTHVAVAGFDILRDEGLAYADALEAAGVRVTRSVHTDQAHGFLHLTRLASCRRATDTLVAALRRGLAAPRTVAASVSQPRA